MELLERHLSEYTAPTSQARTEPFYVREDNEHYNSNSLHIQGNNDTTNQHGSKPSFSRNHRRSEKNLKGRKSELRKSDQSTPL